MGHCYKGVARSIEYCNIPSSSPQWEEWRYPLPHPPTHSRQVKEALRQHFQRLQMLAKRDIHSLLPETMLTELLILFSLCREAPRTKVSSTRENLYIKFGSSAQLINDFCPKQSKERRLPWTAHKNKQTNKQNNRTIRRTSCTPVFGQKDGQKEYFSSLRPSRYHKVARIDLFRRILPRRNTY